VKNQLTLKFKKKRKITTTIVEPPPANPSFHASEYRKMLEQQLDKIEGGMYVPNQTYDRFRGKNPTSAFGATADLLRGIHNSVSQAKPDNETDSIALASTLRSKEQKVLLEHATKNNLLIDHEQFRTAWENSGLIQGSEHQVILNEKDQTVVKRRMLWANETNFTSLNKIDTHNAIFPESAYTLKGFLNDQNVSPVYTQPMYVALSEESSIKSLQLSKQDLGHLTSILQENKHSEALQFISDRVSKLRKGSSPTKQKELDLAKEMLFNPDMKTEVSYEEIKSYMKKKGFEPDLESIKDLAGYKFDDSIDISIDLDFGTHSKPQHSINSTPIVDNEHTELLDFLIFRNEKTGMQVRDLAPRNFIRTTTGEVICVDPMILPNIKTQAERIKEELKSL